MASNPGTTFWSKGARILKGSAVPHSRWARYGLAAGLIAVIFAVRFGFHPILDQRIPLAIFLPAAFLSAWFGRVGPGLLALALGFLLGDLFFLKPLFEFGSYQGSGLAQVTGYLLAGLLGVGFIEILHRTKARLGVSETQERQLQQELRKRQRAESALRESEARFSSIFNGAGIGIVMADMQGYLLECNPAFCRMSGYAREQLRGMTFAEITYAADLELALGVFREMASGAREEFQIETRYVRKQGGLMWARLTVSLLCNSEGRPQYAIGTIEDISARKQIESDLHQSEERYRALVEQSPDAILVHREGIYLYANPAAVRLFGGACAADLVGRKVLDLIHPGSREMMSTHLQFMVAQGVSTTPLIEARIMRLNDQPVEIESTSRLIAFEQLPAFQVIMRDITERKQVERQLQQAQEKLRAYADQLEERVVERTATLEKSFESLEALLYHVTHDLRAPLRAIQGFTGIALHSASASADPELLDFLQRSYQASEKMDRLIADLLEFGRVGHQQMALCAVDPEQVLKQVIAGLSGEVEQKRARIELQRPVPKVSADAAMLERVFTNLVGNALKFVPPDTAPRIRIWADTDGQTVRLHVQDNGIGIAREDQEKIFVAFRKLHDAKTYPGTGVGLAMVRKGLERMAGRIGVESQVGQGSRFWLELKAAGQPGEQELLDLKSALES